MFVNERELSCKSDVKEEKKGLMISTSDDELLLLKRMAKCFNNSTIS